MSSTEALLRQAVVLHRTGDLPRAARLYQRILHQEPRQPDALHLMGMVHHRQGRSELAFKLVSASLQVRPDEPSVLNNLGLVLRSLGQPDRAATVFQRAAQLQPDLASAWTHLGLCQAEAGRLEEAEASHRRALDADPDNVAARSNLVRVLREQDRLPEARAEAERAVADDPTHLPARVNLATILSQLQRPDEARKQLDAIRDLDPQGSLEIERLYCDILFRHGDLDEAGRRWRSLHEAHPDRPDIPTNLGALAETRGHFQEAERWYRRSLDLEENAPAWINLATLYRQQGAPDRANEALDRAAALEPEHPDLHAARADLLRSRGRPGEAVDARREALKRRPGDPTLLAALARDLVAASPPSLDTATEADLLAILDSDAAEIPGLADLAARLTRQWLEPRLQDVLRESAEPGDPDLLPLLDAPLVRAALDRIPLRGPHWERILADIRRQLAALGPPETDRHWRVLGSCALQAWHRGYVGDPDPAEVSERSPLRLLQAPPDPDQQQPPHPALAPLWRHALELPAACRELESSIPTLSLPNADPSPPDPTSRAVQAHYERNPYPRWQALAPGARQPLAAVVANLFPHLDPPAPESTPRILVAGCGTGRHALAVARHYAGSRVTAVDLSRASLAYATRKAREMGVDSVRFLQADLLTLGDWEERFHHVEASGVLHHLEDPVAGWRILRDLLLPGGTMKVSLYSETARAPVVAAREELATKGLAPTDDPPPDLHRIRAARRHLLDLPEAHPAHPVVHSPDFYHPAAVADLLFHPHEHRFHLPGIADILDALDLDWMGLEVNPETARAFRDHFPDAPPGGDPEHWTRFEELNPRTFTGMYTLWCQRR